MLGDVDVLENDEGFFFAEVAKTEATGAWRACIVVLGMSSGRKS